MEEWIVGWLRWFGALPLPVEILIALAIGCSGLILLIVLIKLVLGILHY